MVSISTFSELTVESEEVKTEDRVIFLGSRKDKDELHIAKVRRRFVLGQRALKGSDNSRDKGRAFE